MQKKQKNKKKHIVSDMIFYGILFSLVIGVLTISGNDRTGPRVFCGYSAFVVLTGSMEDVIPKGSLVVSKNVDPDTLQIGDDITYMVSESTTVTHRIIEFVEDYPLKGERGFRTQGVMNVEPDRNPVAAVNVVGKVIYHNKLLGLIISYGQDNWPLLLFLFVVLLIFVKVVDGILQKEPVGEVTPLERNTKDRESRLIEDDMADIEIIEL